MTQESDFIEVIITPEMLAEARRKSHEMGKLNNSILEGAGNVTGFLGEAAAVVALGPEAKTSNTYNHDVLYKGKRLEVKSKKRRDPPEARWDCSVSNYNAKQKCDMYVFVSVLNDYSKAYVCGWKGKDDYFKIAEKMTKGKTDSNIVNGTNFKFHCDCFNAKYGQLEPISSLR